MHVGEHLGEGGGSGVKLSEHDNRAISVQCGRQFRFSQLVPLLGENI